MGSLCPWEIKIPNWTSSFIFKSSLKEINPEYSLEGLMLKLKLQYFDHLMQRTDSLEKTLTLGKIEGRRRRCQQKKRWLDSIIYSMDMSLSKLQEMVKDREVWHPWCVARSWTQLSDWTTNQGREGMQRQGRSSQETNSLGDWVLVSSQGIYRTVSLRSSTSTTWEFPAELKPPANRRLDEALFITEKITVCPWSHFQMISGLNESRPCTHSDPDQQTPLFPNPQL